MERGVTKVNATIYSDMNVEHMKSRVLMGNKFGQPLEARLIKWKLGLLWRNEVKSNFFLDHYGRKWFVVEFSDDVDLEYVLNHRPSYVRGQIFHLERWTYEFRDLDLINKLVVWARLSRLPVKYKDEHIIKTIAQPLGDIVKVDEIILGLNGVFVKVLVEMDLRFPLKRALIVNDDDDHPMLGSYNKLFEVCFYCGKRRLDGHTCMENDVEDGCFLIERAFDDEPLIFPKDTKVDEDLKDALHGDVMLCFPMVVNNEDKAEDGEEQCVRMSGDLQDEEGLTTVVNLLSEVYN